ncbi:hypothetical protein [Nostoc sp.]
MKIKLLLLITEANNLPRLGSSVSAVDNLEQLSVHDKVYSILPIHRL